MGHDLIISGGTIIDGTGADGVRADVAIDGDRITRIGDLGHAEAARRIDATGRLVTPGFVDLHTHFDAQVGWDPVLRSSSYHGVTTCLMGNCGVSFAPAMPANHEYIAKIMESVEDIPADQTMEGLPWNWKSYGEYLDSIQSLKPALNVVGMAGHSPIRYEAMGDKAMDEGVQASPDELTRIERLVRESIEGGAVGFSTSRLLGHKVPDGRIVPGTWADTREIETIQRAALAAGGRGTLYQQVSDFVTRFETELEILEQGAELGCQVLFSYASNLGGDVDRVQELLERNNRGGRRMATVAPTRPSGVLVGLVRLLPFETPGWQELMTLSTVADRVERLAEPNSRKKLTAEAKEAGFRWGFGPESMHPLGLGEWPDHDIDGAASLKQLADEAGIDPIDLYVERLIQSEGRELTAQWHFGFPAVDEQRYLTGEYCVPMVGDSGAHVSMVMDADSPTFLLSELTRERGVFTLPDAIHRITQQSAEILGLRERGIVREGWYADLNVIDYENLASAYPEYVYDFPLGGGRLICKSQGYVATLVAGQPIIECGVHSEARPGRVIREFERG